MRRHRRVFTPYYVSKGGEGFHFPLRGSKREEIQGDGMGGIGRMGAMGLAGPKSFFFPGQCGKKWYNYVGEGEN